MLLPPGGENCAVDSDISATESFHVLYDVPLRDVIERAIRQAEVPDRRGLESSNLESVLTFPAGHVPDIDIVHVGPLRSLLPFAALRVLTI